MVELLKCDVCGHDVASDAKLCPNCGHRIQPVAPIRITDIASKVAKGSRDFLHSFTKRLKRPLHCCLNFAAFLLKLLCVFILNGFIMAVINSFFCGASSGSSNYKTTYLTCNIAATILFPFSLGLSTLAIIKRHYGNKARLFFGGVFFVFLLLGSFGPVVYLGTAPNSNLGTAPDIFEYYVVRIIVLFVFLLCVLPKRGLRKQDEAPAKHVDKCVHAGVALSQDECAT